MTTSGTDTFNPPANAIILSALRKCGAFASGETPDAQSITDAQQALNGLIKEWDAMGIHVWTETEGILFLQPGQVQYQIGPGSPDHVTANWFITSTATLAAPGANAIQLASVVGVAAAYNIGITLDAGNIFWTTVNGAPSGSTVNLSAALPSQASVGNPVYCYQTAAVRPLRVFGARRFNSPSLIETPMITMSRLDYMNLPNKKNPGTITQYFYTPSLGTGLLYVWPAPMGVIQDAVRFTFARQIQDINTAANTPDFPQEWFSTLVFNLAVEIGPEYDVPLQKLQWLKQEAASKLDRVAGWDREPEPVLFGVSYDASAR